MMVSFIGHAIILMIIGIVLLLIGVRNGHDVPASMGGFFLGISVVVLAFEFFYLRQLGERNPGIVYNGSAITEMLLGASLTIGLTLIMLSMLGLWRHKPFWRCLT